MAVRRKRTRNSKLWCKKTRRNRADKKAGKRTDNKEGPTIDRPQTTQERNAECLLKRRQQEFKASRLV